jgi:hypothetical protein
MLKRALICVASILFVSGAAAAKDVPGGKDHPLIGRYDGAALTLYKTSDYAEQRILTRPITSADRRATGKRLNANNSVAAAGRSFRLRYDGPAGRSPLEVARNFQSGLKAKGFEILFDRQGAACSDLSGSELYFALQDESLLGKGDIHSNPASQLFTTAKLARPQGDVYATIYVGDFAKAPEVLVDVVETAPMDDGKIVFVDVAKM